MRMPADGEWVVLLHRSGDKYLVRVEDREFQSSMGILKLGELRTLQFGQTLKSHLGEEFLILPPSLPDFYEKLRRAPQVVLPKDAAQVVAQTGIGPGDLVVDGGTGSGWLAIFLGNLVRPDGRVYTYEIREEFARLAEENIRKVGLEKIVTVRRKDIYQGIDETELDLVTLDVPEPHRVVPHAEKALRVGGYLAAFTPCIETLQQLYQALRGGKFAELKTVECLVREILVRPGATRPSTEMIAHTSYLTVARRI
jgi:tRNA (adenine57-N1/adenine58-N1)-methyltransferase